MWPFARKPSPVLDFDLIEIPKGATVLVRPVAGLPVEAWDALNRSLSQAAEKHGFHAVVLDPSIAAAAWVVSLPEQGEDSDDRA